eukprot:11773752-Alexandrium_andersonii.AAC.1
MKPRLAKSATPLKISCIFFSGMATRTPSTAHLEARPNPDHRGPRGRLAPRDGVPRHGGPEA